MGEGSGEGIFRARKKPCQNGDSAFNFDTYLSAHSGILVHTLSSPPTLRTAMNSSTTSTHVSPILIAPSLSPLTISGGILRFRCLLNEIRDVRNCRRWSTRLCGGLGVADIGGRIGLPIDPGMVVAVVGVVADWGGRLLGAPAAVAALGVGGSVEAWDFVEDGGGPNPIWVVSVEDGRLGIDAGL